MGQSSPLNRFLFLVAYAGDLGAVEPENGKARVLINRCFCRKAGRQVPSLPISIAATNEEFVWMQYYAKPNFVCINRRFTITWKIINCKTHFTSRAFILLFSERGEEKGFVGIIPTNEISRINSPG